MSVPTGDEWTSELLGNEDPPAWCCPGVAGIGVSELTSWELTRAAVVVGLDFAPPTDPDDCETCDGEECTLGGSDYGLGCMYVKMKLGPGTGGGSAGTILLSSNVPDANWATPAGLVVSADKNDPGVEVVLDGNGVTRQVVAPNGVADIVTIDDHTYEVRFYYMPPALNLVNGVYDLQGNPFKTLRFEHPDDTSLQPVAPDPNRLRVTETSGGSVKVFEFKYTPEDEVTDPKWELFDPVDPELGESAVVRSMTSVTTEVPAARVETFEDTDPATSTVTRKVLSRYETFAWGEEMVKRVVWHDASGQEADQLVTVWTYYDDEVNDGDNYGQLKQMLRPNGYWERYEYDSTGRLIKQISQRDNALPTAAESDSYVTVYTYTTADLDTPVDSANEVVTTTIEKAPDPANPGQLIEMARQYHIDWSGTTSQGGQTLVESWDIVCRTPGAAWDAADNLATKIWTWNSGDLERETWKVAYPDGRISLTEKSGSTTTVFSGYPNAQGAAVVEGTKTVMVVDGSGYQQFSKTYVLRTGLPELLVERQETTAVDDFGRPEEITYWDGTTSQTQYDCCHVASRTDRQGVTTHYLYDDNTGHLIKLTRGDTAPAKTITSYEYDANGRQIASHVVMDLDEQPPLEYPDLVSTTDYDLAGRVIQQTDPEGQSTYYTYGYESVTGKGYEERRVYPHSNTCGPIQVVWTDGRGNVVRQFTASTAAAWSDQTPPTGSEALTELTRTTYESDWRGRSIVTRTYFNLSGLTQAAVGAEGVNYYESESLAFDEALGVALREKDTVGDIVARVYDDGGRVLSEWRGTDDTGATRTDPSAGGTNNMVKVAAYYYDSDRDGTGDPREYATRSEHLAPTDAIQYVHVDSDISYEPTTVSMPGSDYTIGMRRETSTPQVDAGPQAKRIYDVSGRLTDTETKTNDGQTLLAKQSNVYDAAGRLSATRVYEVDSGVAGNYIETAYAYDEIGRRVSVRQPSGGLTKMEYDGAGRVIRTWQASDDNDTATAADDTVLVESVSAYDDAGNVIQTTTYVRNHDAGAYVGLLSSDSSKAQVSYSAIWYDNAHRPIATADYGNNGGAAFTRPASAPAAADDVLVTQVAYDAAGRQSTLTDSKGVVTKSIYDVLGRRLYQIEGYNNFDETVSPVAGTGGGTNADQDRVTQFEYNAASQVVQQIALDPDADGNLSDNQVTKYVYASELTDKGSPVASNNLLRGVIYPDSDNTVANNVFNDGGGYDRIEMTYYSDGSLKTRKDQRSVVLTHEYDNAGRRTSQAVTGTVDGDQQVDYAYTALGQLETITTYSDAGTTITSQVKYEYNGLGQVKTEYQDHDSAVDITAGSGSPRIAYTYDTDTTNNAFTYGHRLDTTTYPNGRVIHTTYAAGIDAATSRASGLAEDNAGAIGDSIVDYSYLGSGRVVMKDYPTPDVRLNYYDTTSATYTGFDRFDRFGRIINQQWDDYSAGAGNEFALWQAQHAYDRASNRLYADREVYGSYSEVYTYDDLHRLKTFDQGKIKADQSGIEDHWRVNKHTWSLDALGNQLQWAGIDDEVYVKNTPNAANEYSARLVRGNHTPDRSQDDQFDSDTTANWSNPGGGGDGFSINDGSDGYLTITSVGADTVDGHTERLLPDPASTPEPRTIVLYGEPSEGNSVGGRIYFPNDSGQAGFVFGYKSFNDYWVRVLDAGADRVYTYHVVDGVKTEIKSKPLTIPAGSDQWLYLPTQSKAVNWISETTITDGMPSGRWGVYSNTAGVKFQEYLPDRYRRYDDMAGRWLNDAHIGGSGNAINVNTDKLFLVGIHTNLIRDLRANQFEMYFNVTPQGGSTYDEIRILFDYKNESNYKYVRLKVGPGGSAKNPTGEEIVDGEVERSIQNNSVATSPPAIGVGEVPWVRITSDGLTVKVYIESSPPSTKPTWSNVVFEGNTFYEAPTGGMLGITAQAWNPSIDDLTVKTHPDVNGDFQVTEHIEDFTIDANGYADIGPTYDAAGNLTYDGVHQYAYDAWNRLVKAAKAYRDPTTGDVTPGSVVADMRYDGLGRRIEKAVQNSADLDCTYGFFYNGQQLVETRDGSDLVLKQYVWGLQYIDELVQVGVNDDPADGAEDDVESFYYAIHNANYNVQLMVDAAGAITERYEYDPYGQRHVFFSPGLNDPQAYASTYISRRLTVGGIPQPYGLCEFGHQGLFHDEELGLIYNLARMLHPKFGRFMQRDPLGYVDGMSTYYRNGSPDILDPEGLATISIDIVAPVVDIIDNYKEWKKSVAHAPIGSAGLTDHFYEVDVDGVPSKRNCCCKFTIKRIKMRSHIYVKNFGIYANYSDVTLYHERKHHDLLSQIINDYAAVLTPCASCCGKDIFGFPIKETANSCEKKSRRLEQLITDNIGWANDKVQPYFDKEIYKSYEIDKYNWTKTGVDRAYRATNIYYNASIKPRLENWECRDVLTLGLF
ncbi:RHS repeat protein [Planctomycetales bacterium ZRK34]|nr:RHS repeat protein [Planctomycetales bacterium ZRK34]